MQSVMDVACQEDRSLKIIDEIWTSNFVMVGTFDGPAPLVK